MFDGFAQACFLQDFLLVYVDITALSA